MKRALKALRAIDPAKAGIFGVATAAAVLSFSSLMGLAESTDTWVGIAWMLPISLDAAAATATFVWLRTDQPKVARLAAAIAWSTIGLSVVGNGVHHAFRSLGIDPWWWVALIVGTVPPAVFGAVVHLAIKATKAETTTDQRDDQDDHLRSIVAEPVVEPEPQTWSGPDTVELPRRRTDTVPVEVEPVRQLRSVDWSVDQIVAQLREQGRTDPDQRGLQRYIRDTYGAGAVKAKQAIEQLKRPSEVAS